jgi:predicted DCC family thiol-disulfide oxidoreductase YuxK
MRIFELIVEAPVSHYEPIGDFSKPGSFKDPVDKKLVVHPVNIDKVYKFFQDVSHDFRIFPVNLPKMMKYRESGEASPEKIKEIFGKDADRILNGHESAITILFLGNFGAERVMLTPWMVAHRLGHAIQASNRQVSKTTTAWGKAEQLFFKSINEILAEFYGKKSSSGNYGVSHIKWDMSDAYSALFNSIGTQRSSRTGQIKRPYEFLHELFAQYLKTGEITFNPLPTSLGYGRKAWGNPTKYLNIRREYSDKLSRTQELERLAVDLQAAFYDVLDSQVGKILLM